MLKVPLLAALVAIWFLATNPASAQSNMAVGRV